MEAIPALNGSNPCNGNKGNSKPRHSNMFAEAKELQELMLQDAKREGLKPIERSALGRVWKELGEFRLRLQGKGPPKAVDYASRKPRKPAVQGFTETAIELGKVKAKPAPNVQKPDTTQLSGTHAGKT